MRFNLQLVSLITATLLFSCSDFSSQSRQDLRSATRAGDLDAVPNNDMESDRIKVDASGHGVDAEEARKKDEDKPPTTAEEIAEAIDNLTIEEIAEIKQGAELYQTFCSDCHGAISDSSQRGASASEIATALENIPQMNALLLSAGQIERISIALENTDITIAIIAEKPTDTYLPLATRTWVSSNLKVVFGGANQNQIDQIVDVNITSRYFAFGGICELSETDCHTAHYGQQETRLRALMHPVASPVRSAFIVRSCELLLDDSTAQANLLNNANLTSSAVIDADSLASLHDLFFPGQVFDKDVQFALLQVNSTAKSLGLSSEETWKYVALPLCSSSIMGAI